MLLTEVTQQTAGWQDVAVIVAVLAFNVLVLWIFYKMMKDD